MQTVSAAPAQQRLIVLSNVGFYLVAAVLLFGGLGATGLWNSEDRWAEVAREMHMSGNYFLPTLNGALYFDKPLLSYWLVLIGSALTGAINEWSLRLPSALSGLVVLWSTVGLGRLLWSDAVGRLAGWLLLASYGLLMWARLGEADMENCAAATLAVYWYWRHRERTDFFNYWVFYLILFIGAQTKGLAALVVPLLAVLPDLWREGRYRRHVNFAHGLAAAAGFLVYLLPFLLSRQGSGGSSEDAGLLMVFRENVVRYFAPFDHDDPFYTYLWALPLLFMPWVPLLLAALAQALRTRALWPAATRWLISAFGLIFLFFSISGSRRIYYILPLLPYCALLTAIFFSGNDKPRWKRIALAAQALVLGAMVAFNLMLPLLREPIAGSLGGALPEALNLNLCAAIGAAALLWWLVAIRLGRGDRFSSILPALIGVALLVLGGFFLLQREMFDAARTKWKFAAELRSQAQSLDAAQIAVFRGRPSAGLLFYADLPVPVSVPADAEALRRFVHTPPYPKLVVSGSEYADEMPQALRDLPPTLRERRNPWEKAKDNKWMAWRLEQAPAP